MQGNESKIVYFLQGFQKRFVIPVYQRKYNWQIGQCRQLYDDLVKTIKYDRKNHFFGSLVSYQGPEEAKEEYLIIDGQQRITTVSLLMLAMIRQMEKAIVKTTDGNLSTLLYHEYLIDKYKEGPCIKLRLVEEDQAALRRLFAGDSDHIPDSNLTVNYQYFLNRIGLEEIGIDELYEAIKRLEIIDIFLKEGDNPQLIFESLNSTGMALSEGDKIRNFLLMNQTSSKQKYYYNNYWKQIEGVTQDDKDITSMFRDFLSIKTQQTPRMDKVYFAFRDYSESILSDEENQEGFFGELLAYARWFGQLGTAHTSDDELNTIIYRLNRLRVTVARPFLLEVLRIHSEGFIDIKSVTEAFGVVENYVYRRYICGVPTNALNKIFVTLHRDIERLEDNLDDYVEKLKYVLQRKRASGRFPDDAEFKEALTTKNIYNLSGDGKAYLFVRLENYNTLETKDVWTHLDKGTYSIEHIMPQKLSNEWKTSLGEDYERIHEVWIHRLANLTLTGYNAKYSNFPFHKKRDMGQGFKDSGLRMNSWIAKQEQWGEAELKKRSNHLLKQALMIWPYSKTTYEPKEDDAASRSLGDDEYELTGSSISQYILEGEKHSVGSWVEMYLQVLQKLHEKNPIIFTSLALDTRDDAESAIHFATSEKSGSYRKIDEGVFIFVATSTRNKIRMLRKIFQLFDLEPEELIFLVHDAPENDELITNRGSLLMSYWEGLIPRLREATSTFTYVNPVPSNWIRGSLRWPHVGMNVVANYQDARVELSFQNPDKEENKRLFDALYRQRQAIEAKAGQKFIWDRVDDSKLSKIYLKDTSIGIKNVANWPDIMSFQVNGARTIVRVFEEYLEKYFADAKLSNDNA